MTWSRVLLVPLVVAAIASPAPAGLFSRKTKPNPAERVPELLIQLKTGTDEAQRTAAAEELRQYDPKAFPEIVTGLIDALGKDASPAVRSEAAASLGRLRPIAQQTGYALEQAQNNDASVRVRLAARQSLWQYHLVGYRGGKTDMPAGNAAADPSVSAPPGPSTPAQPTSRSRPASRPPAPGRESPEPPLATPPTSLAPLPPAPPVGSEARLLPVNPGLQPNPGISTAPATDGPALPPG